MPLFNLVNVEITPSLGSSSSPSSNPRPPSRQWTSVTRQNGQLYFVRNRAAPARVRVQESLEILDMPSPPPISAAPQVVTTATTTTTTTTTTNTTQQPQPPLVAPQPPLVAPQPPAVAPQPPTVAPQPPAVAPQPPPGWPQDLWTQQFVVNARTRAEMGELWGELRAQSLRNEMRELRSELRSEFREGVGGLGRRRWEERQEDRWREWERDEREERRRWKREQERTQAPAFRQPEFRTTICNGCGLRMITCRCQSWGL